MHDRISLIKAAEARVAARRAAAHNWIPQMKINLAPLIDDDAEGDADWIRRLRARRILRIEETY